jgi:mRNA-degrading endonuclease RelE of RelBE toxin-antitoxin system
MSYKIIPTPNFEKSLKRLAKRYRSIKTDFNEFIQSLKDNPLQGTELTPGIRKIRMSISSKGKGKSGGARVITYQYVSIKNSGPFTFSKSMINQIHQPSMYQSYNLLLKNLIYNIISIEVLP